jgi:hypothetical protein
MRGDEIFQRIFYLCKVMEGVMKKIILTVLVFFAVAAVCPAAGTDIPVSKGKILHLLEIKITMPKGGEQFPLQMALNVNWDYFSASSPIELLLFRGGTDSGHKVGTIVRNFPIGAGGHGSYPWNVGKMESGYASIGNEYRIQIISGAFNHFSNPFSIISSEVTDSPGHEVLPQKGECVISEFSLTPVEGNNPHLSLLIKCQNKSSRLLRNLKLTLIKNHFPIKEWSPIGINPGAAFPVSYQDAMPSPGNTHHYIAILSWGDPIAQPQSVLDRKETQYRRGGTVIGHL